MKKWYETSSNNSDVVLYSKAVLVRNLENTVFPSKMSDELKRSVVKKVFACIKNSPLAQEFDLVNLTDCPKAQAMSYAEKELISQEFLNSKSSFLLSKEEDVTVMINEEDHIKITSFAPGQNIDTAYNKANDVDDIFINGLNISFSKKYGFLTSSPMNLGTGLKVSVALHLPAIAEKGLISKLATTVSKLGFTLKELFNNGAGSFYVLTNTVTLGITEKSAVDNLDAVCTQIVNQERNIRENLKSDTEFEDKIYRTLGILKLARKLSFDELLDSISYVRLGIALGYFEYSYELIGELIYNLFDATLVNSSKSDLTQQMCETMRAEIVRNRL